MPEKNTIWKLLLEQVCQNPITVMLPSAAAGHFADYQKRATYQALWLQINLGVNAVSVSTSDPTQP